MPKEPGENTTERTLPEMLENLSDEAKKEMARSSVELLDEELADIDSKEKVDLNEESTHSKTLIRADVLKNTVERIKLFYHYLSPKEQDSVDDLIITAEIYLANHEPVPKTEK
jgi:hypothetical protein